MLFSVNYKSSHKQEADEIRCPYNQLGTIFDFIKNNPTKRYVIVINDTINDKILEQINFIKEVAEDYSIQCNNIAQMQSLIAAGYHAFPRFPISDWETFDEMRQLEVSDIYIDGPLGFQCEALEAFHFCSPQKIRVSPTISPNASFIARSPSSFFIRPEDLYLYESAIDVIDFKVPNTDKEDALFSIYKRGTFNYDIDQLIKGLPSGINNIMISPEFCQYRTNCSQKCKQPNRSCHLCENSFTIVKQGIQLAQMK